VGVRNGLPSPLGRTPICQPVLLCAESLSWRGLGNYIIDEDFMAAVVRSWGYRRASSHLRASWERKGSENRSHQGYLQAFLHAGQSYAEANTPLPYLPGT